MGERGRRYPKIGTYGHMREGVRSNADVTTMYSLNAYILYIWNYLPHGPSPSIMTKATKVTSGVWQWVMRGCGDKRSYNGDNKTKEDECKSVNTTYNLFCSFIRWWCKHYIASFFCHLSRYLNSQKWFITIYPRGWGKW